MFEKIFKAKKGCSFFLVLLVLVVFGFFIHSFSSTEMSTDSPYVGMTVEEFEATGADLNGYINLNGSYQFKAKNKAKNEEYVFTLDGDVKSAMQSNNNNYDDCLDDFVISGIQVESTN